MINLHQPRHRWALNALLCTTLLCSPLTAQDDWDDFVPDVEFDAEEATLIPAHELEADLPAVVHEILNDETVARDRVFYQFGEESVAELLRVLAAWPDKDANRAYERLLEWNIDYFYEFDTSLQKRFIRTVAGRPGEGAARVRGDVAMALLNGIAEGQPSGAMLKAAEYLEALLAGTEGAQMLLYLEARGFNDRVRPLLAHVLIWNWNGKKIVGETLGGVAHQVALRHKGGYFVEEDVAGVQARLLGRAIAHVELAIDDWAASKESGPQASAAHGAEIVRFALDAVDVLTGGVSTVVTAPIRLGVDRLEEYETSQEPPPADPAAELRSQMFRAVVVPFHKLVTDDVTLDEEEMQVLVESFRRNVEDGRNSSWSG